MTGALTPVVLIPRYTSFLGENEFISEAIDASMYCAGALRLWRGELKGTDTPTYLLFVETSNDKNVWVPQDVAGYDPGANDSMPITLTLTQRWLRTRVVLEGTNPAVTCWCAGTLERRVR